MRLWPLRLSALRSRHLAIVWIDLGLLRVVVSHGYRHNARVILIWQLPNRHGIVACLWPPPEGRGAIISGVSRRRPFTIGRL